MNYSDKMIALDLFPGINISRTPIASQPNPKHNSKPIFCFIISEVVNCSSLETQEL